MEDGSLWAKFKRKAFALESLSTHRARCGVNNGLKRVLTAFDLLMFGVGGIVGAGVFVLTGEAAQKYAGCDWTAKKGESEGSWACLSSFFALTKPLDGKPCPLMAVLMDGKMFHDGAKSLPRLACC